MADAAYLVHLHAPFGHAQHYLGWSADPPWRLRHHAAGTGSNLLRHVRLAGIGWSLVRVWPGATRTVERSLHKQGGASRLCPYCCSRERRVQLPGGGWLAPIPGDYRGRGCSVPGCSDMSLRLRAWGRSRRAVCELHACAYAARQHGASSSFTTMRQEVAQSSPPSA